MKDRYIKRRNVREDIEKLADGGKYMRVDLTIYRHLNLMVQHEIERIVGINKGKRKAHSTIELSPE